jgi:predicted RNA-binding Zn-ribbon protein involved in translation (DUF1610 family)
LHEVLNAALISRAAGRPLLTRAQEHKHCLQPGCGFDGPDQAALTQHLKHDHFQCEGCKRILPSQTQLNKHYENCSFAVACPQCGEPCAGKGQLALHLQSCYLCEECGFLTHHEGNFDIVSHVTSDPRSQH